MTAPGPDCTRIDVPAQRGWLLVEHPGPWGFSVEQTAPGLPAAVRSAADALDFRINLIRPYGRWRHHTSGRCFVSSFAGGPPLLEEVPAALLERRFAGIATALAAGRPSGLGTPVTRPMFLVCTNGRRNPGCGRSGRGLARAVADAAGGRAWETTHVGGCRFAANLVCLPTGVFYRGIEPHEAAVIVEATDRGRLVLPRYGGRSGLSPEAQAAEWAVRRATGLDGVAEVRVTGSRPGDVASHRHVEVLTPAGTHRVTVVARGPAGHRYDVLATGRDDTPRSDRGQPPEHGHEPMSRREVAT